MIRAILITAALMMLAGCGALPTTLSAIYTPGPDKTAKVVKGYCSTASAGLRSSFRGALNHHADPHDAFIWCDGEDPPWIGSERWAAWRANNQEDPDR